LSANLVKGLVYLVVVLNDEIQRFLEQIIGIIIPYRV